MLMGGEPFSEPRHIYWNFVSSSAERIEQAKADWRERRFAEDRSYGLVDSDLPSGRMALLNPPILETTMQQVANPPEQAAIRIDLGAIFVSMELSRSSWLITSLSPGGGEKMSSILSGAGTLRDSWSCLRRSRKRLGHEPASGGRLRKPLIVALARKLLVALWQYATAGVVMEGSTIKPA